LGDGTAGADRLRPYEEGASHPARVHRRVGPLPTALDADLLQLEGVEDLSIVTARELLELLGRLGARQR
jgi:hypothetical protein